jgi:hypothetical protein
MKARIATRIIPLLAAQFAALLLAGCAGLVGPRQVEVPLYKLQESLSGRFPFNNRYLDLLDINVSNPRISLQPNTNRILTSMDALVAPPFLRKSWKGNFTLSGALRYDPSRNAIMLADPRVEGFAVDGLDPLYARQIGKVGSLLAEQVLREVPLYTFRPDELRYAGTRFIPTRINTALNGLVVTFEPAR